MPNRRNLLFFLLCLATTAIGQPDSIRALIEAQNRIDTTSFSFPMFGFNKKTVALDSIIFSKDSIDAPLEYAADDSMHLDATAQVVHLYGNATVKYQQFSLRAAYIALSVESKIVVAEGLPDSLGRLGGFPVFEDGKENFTAKKIRYNFETRQGIVYDVTTQQQGGYIRGGRAKIKLQNDSTAQHGDEFFGQDGIFTTCNHETPHFGIRSSKLKFVPNEEVIVGPSNLEIMGIPTPLWIPFGFFPLNVKQSSGLLFPKDYEFSPQFGFGLRNVGWYFGLGEHADLRLTGDIYSRGSWGVNANLTYRFRYKMSGNFTLGYAVRQFGDSETPEFSKSNSLVIRWSHSQDAKAHPTQSFNGNINFQINNYLNQINNDAESVLTNQLSSNVSYTKTWTGKPYRLSISLNHSQNTKTREVNVTLPQLDFNVSRIEPFKRKKSVGVERWYEKIGFTYNFQARNSITATDTTIFTREALNDAQYGMKHTIPFGTSFNILKYFNVAPNINYTEKWYFNTVEKNFDPTSIITSDTTFDSEGNVVSVVSDTTFGTVSEARQFGFKSLREFNAGVSVSTQLFGNLNNLRIGRLRAVRHVVKPSVSYVYTPDYTASFWGYFNEVQLDSRYPEEVQRYSIFEDGIYGAPSSSGLSSALGFTINNILEGKIRERGDTLDTPKGWKKVKLLQNLTLNGSWNFAADSLQLTPISLRGNTLLFNKITLAFGATFDPYAANINTNNRINTFEWTANQRLARLTNASLTLSTSLRWQEIKDILEGKTSSNNPTPTTLATSNEVPIVDNIRIGYEIRAVQRYVEGVDSFYLSAHNINLSGTVNLTSKWRITVGRIGYDFAQKKITYPDFQFARDLHCWEMGASWQPTRQTYSFFIRVKQAPLDFIKIPYGKSNFDTVFQF